MKIVVCMKLGLDVNIPSIINPASGLVDEALLEYRMDGSSIAALEMALRLKEKHQADISVVSIAPESADSLLQEVYALGADRIFRIWHENLEDADAYQKGVTIAALLRDTAPDLVLCGARSEDMGSGMVPAVLAELMNFSQVTNVAADIELLNQDSILAFRRLEQGAREKLQVQLPAVVSVDLTATGMPYAPLDNYLAARDKLIEHMEIFDLGLSSIDISSWNTLNRLVNVAQQKPVSKSIYTPPSELDPLDRIRAIVSGGLQQKTGEVVQGDAEELAEKAFQFLLQYGFC